MNRLSYRFKLWQLQSKEKKLARSFKPEIEQAQKNNDHNTRMEVIAQWQFEDEEYRDGIALLETQYLTSLAHRHLIALPARPIGDDENESWYTSRWTGRKILCENARRRLLREIKQSQKERRAECLSWLAAITGIIGAITGLVAVILR